MNFNEYQKLAMRTSGRYDNKSEQLKCAALGLSGESGEFNDLVKKQLYHFKAISPEMKKKELGDVLWYVALACDAEGFDMDDVAKGNIQKLVERYPQGFSYQAANAPRPNEVQA